MSTVAKFDWPDDYPELLSQLVDLLTTESFDAIDGSMRVISEFVKNDLSEDQLVPLMQNLLPAILAVFKNEVYLPVSGRSYAYLTASRFRNTGDNHKCFPPGDQDAGHGSGAVFSSCQTSARADRTRLVRCLQANAENRCWGRSNEDAR